MDAYVAVDHAGAGTGRGISMPVFGFAIRVLALWRAADLLFGPLLGQSIKVLNSWASRGRAGTAPGLSAQDRPDLFQQRLDGVGLWQKAARLGPDMRESVSTSL